MKRLLPCFNVKEQGHCERSEAIHEFKLHGLPRRCATRNDVCLSLLGVAELPRQLDGQALTQIPIAHLTKAPITMTVASQLSTESASCDALTVMYDGACPLCRREVALYQSLKPLTPVAWLDVSKHSEVISPSEQTQYMARFHVRQSNGQLLDGAAAFVALWLAMPGWRWLGKLGRLPGVTPLLELAYRVFLRLRPLLQRWMRDT